MPTGIKTHTSAESRRARVSSGIRASASMEMPSSRASSLLQVNLHRGGRIHAGASLLAIARPHDPRRHTSPNDALTTSGRCTTSADPGADQELHPRLSAGFASPVWRAEHRSEGRNRPRSGSRQEAGSAQSAHGCAVCAPRRSREAQGHPAAFGRNTKAACPTGTAFQRVRKPQDSTPDAAGRASPGVLSLPSFFSRKRKKVARGQRANPEPHRQPASTGNDTAVGVVDRRSTPCVGLKPDLRPCQRAEQPPGHADPSDHA
jgi:hypothetical protein